MIILLNYFTMVYPIGVPYWGVPYFLAVGVPYFATPKGL